MTIKRDLTSMDFMMMDVHRPTTAEDISEHPQAKVDRSLRVVPATDWPGIDVDELEVHEAYRGPFVNFAPNVEVLGVATSHRLDVDRVLQSAHDHELDTVLVLGTNEDGLYVLGSNPDVAVNNLLCDRAKKYLMDALDNGDTRGVPDDGKEPA